MGIYAGPDIAESGLVLALDAGNTRSYPGSGTTWTDLGGVNNATLVNNPTYSSSQGGNLTFNGSTNWGQISSFSPSRTSRTVEVWANFSSSNSTRWLISQNLSNNSPVYFGFGIDSNNNMYLQAGPNTHSLPLTAISTGVWYQLCVTISGGDTTNVDIRFYLNSTFPIQTTSDSSASAYLPAGGNSWIIGGEYSTSQTPQFQNGFTGAIGNIKMYDRVLTQSEIKQNFNALRGRYGL